MSTVTQCKNDKNHDESFSLEGQKEEENPVSTSVSAIDMAGLTWIFQDDELC